VQISKPERKELGIEAWLIFQQRWEILGVKMKERAFLVSELLEWTHCNEFHLVLGDGKRKSI
jgi:hypothetical protein